MSAAQPKANEPSMEEILASIRRIISDDQPAAAAPPKPAPTPAQAAPVQAAPVQADPAPIAATPQPSPIPVTPPAPKPVPVAVAADEDEEILDLMPKARPERKKEPHFLADDPVGNDVSFEEPKAVQPPVAVNEPSVFQPPSAPQLKPDFPKGQDDIDALMAAAEFDPTPPPVLAPVAPPPPHQRLVSGHTDRTVSTAFTSLANTVLTNNGRTLDDVVTEMLRPMLKNWLDDNLPGIVERLVRAEIERVARGGR